LCKHQSATGEAIEVRSFDVGIAHETNVAPPHIVHQDQHYIRRSVSGRQLHLKTNKKSAKHQSQTIHRSCTPPPTILYQAFPGAIASHDGFLTQIPPLHQQNS
jgi:hypothetical protein